VRQRAKPPTHRENEKKKTKNLPHARQKRKMDLGDKITFGNAGYSCQQRLRKHAGWHGKMKIQTHNKARYSRLTNTFPKSPTFFMQAVQAHSPFGRPNSTEKLCL